MDLSLIPWSRAQFALTAMYHWLFVPLTLGLSIIIAIMETNYVKTGNEKWKKITRFWMKLFAINFAIGVATGLILEFEFGTNWSTYSYFVGDIFGAPLAIEGIFAFFLESTFFAVMFFGWEKVSKRFHLFSTWMVAVGSNLSAVWILVANSWMQNPVGMRFNPETGRNEMESFWDVISSSTVFDTFFHTVTSSYSLSAIFVIGISSWYLIKNREQFLALKSIKIASYFGLLAILVTLLTGDFSARHTAKNQPMKFAAMEAHVNGKEGVGLKALGIVGNVDKALKEGTDPMLFDIEIPGMLSFLTDFTLDSFVPGIHDLIYGNKDRGIISTEEKIVRGHTAQLQFLAYQNAKKLHDIEKMDSIAALFVNPEWKKNYFNYFGYGNYYDEKAEIRQENAFKVIPPISLTFYAFHIMIYIGFWFVLLFIVLLWLDYKKLLDSKKARIWLHLGLWSIPLAWIASQSGWVVSEVGRQPWVIQDLMNTSAAVTNIDTTSVILTFFMFAIIFTVLLIAELKILFTQIGKGSNLSK